MTSNDCITLCFLLGRLLRKVRPAAFFSTVFDPPPAQTVEKKGMGNAVI